MLRMGRRYRFSASHRLHAPSLSEERNREVFGKCNNPYGHGHDYVLEVRLNGEADPETGLLVALKQLDDFVREAVIEHFDHKYLNKEVPAFRESPPTTENIAGEILRRLREGWGGRMPERAKLEGVRIHETRRNIVELRAQ
jgi:6-pyruvoyltetrahydropterin/6-carboxytetrahydropterin synthase